MSSTECRAAKLLAECPIWPRWFAALTLAAASLLLSAETAAASPARYVYEVCDSGLPGGGTAGVVWAPHPTLPFYAENNCAQPGGALVIRQGEVSPGGGASWGVPITPPAGARIESLTVNAAACHGPPSVGSVQVGYESGWPAENCSYDTRSFAWEEGFGGAIVELSCIGECHEGPWVEARYFAATLIDTASPTVSAIGGSLLAPGVRRGSQSVEAQAADQGDGISSISVLVNGVPAATPQLSPCNVAETSNPSVTGTVAAQPAPCPSQAQATWHLNTGAYPFHDGVNRVQVCARDFATLSDSNLTCSKPEEVEVDDSCQESSVGGGAVLSLEFASSHRETVTVGYGKSAVLEGKLTDDAGDPVGGAMLCLKMQTLGIDQRPVPVDVVKTDSKGRYRYRVPAGPDREIVVGYRHDSGQIARAVRYYARNRPSLRVGPARLRNGQRVRLWGQLPGPSSGRRVVVLQAGVAGSRRWITFRRATTDRQGDFEASYRFRSTTRRTTYRFRALVPRQAGYPWVQGHSKAVAVEVSG